MTTEVSIRARRLGRAILHSYNEMLHKRISGLSRERLSGSQLFGVFVFYFENLIYESLC